MTHLGIDPGKEGAIVAITNITGEKEIHPFLLPKIGNDYDIREIREIIMEFNPDMVVIEDVHALPGIGANGNWSLSRGKAILESILTFCNHPFTMVSPKKWQKEMWEGVEKQKRVSKKNKSGYKVDTKATSLLAAKRLFPNVDLTATERSTKPHDGIVDALLMAEYGRRNF